MIIQSILVTVDPVIFTIINKQLHVLLVKRANEPFKDKWSLPGWFVKEDESLDGAANRKLFEETWIKDLYLEQLYTFWEIHRDPSWRTVSIAYMALLSNSNVTLATQSQYITEITFYPVLQLPEMSFDHQHIINYSVQRLKYKLEYTNVAQFLLPSQFTLRELQDVYEIVIWETFDTRNFRKKLDKLKIIQETWIRVVRWVHRPAMLYEFINKEVSIVEVI